jgi:hypothetical protein
MNEEEEEKREVKEYQIKAYIWVTAESEEEAEEKLKDSVLVLDIVSTEEMG